MRIEWGKRGWLPSVLKSQECVQVFAATGYGSSLLGPVLSGEETANEEGTIDRHNLRGP